MIYGLDHTPDISQGLGAFVLRREHPVLTELACRKHKVRYVVTPDERLWGIRWAGVSSNYLLLVPVTRHNSVE